MASTCKVERRRTETFFITGYVGRLWQLVIGAVANARCFAITHMHCTQLVVDTCRYWHQNTNFFSWEKEDLNEPFVFAFALVEKPEREWAERQCNWLTMESYSCPQVYYKSCSSLLKPVLGVCVWMSAWMSACLFKLCHRPGLRHLSRYGYLISALHASGRPIWVFNGQRWYIMSHRFFPI